MATGIFLLQIFNSSVFSVWPELFLCAGWSQLAAFALFQQRGENAEVRLPVFQGEQGGCCCCDSKTALNWVVVAVGTEKGLSGVNTFVLSVKVLWP